MISINNINGKSNSKENMVIYGLSTDEKPIGIVKGYTIGNSSIFVEMDTNKQFFYDEENSRWIEKLIHVVGSGGEIESITSEELAAMWGDD